MSRRPLIVMAALDPRIKCEDTCGHPEKQVKVPVTG